MSTNTETSALKTITANTLSGRAILLHIKITGWQANVTDQDAKDVVMHQFAITNDDRIISKKALIDPEILKPVKNAAQQARAWHYKHSLPWLDGGLRLIGAINLDTHCAKLRELKAVWEEKVRELAPLLPAALAEGKAALGGLGKDEDFPTAEEVLAKFQFDFDMVPVPDKRDIRVELSNEGMALAQASVNKLVNESSKGVLVSIQQRVGEVVNRMIAKLEEKSKKAGKGYAIFRDSLIENALEIVPLIRELNILEDPQVEALAVKLETALKPVDVEKIREDDTYRLEVVEKAKDINNTLAAMSFGGYGEGEEEKTAA